MNKKDELYFDDCPICKAQKLADEKGKELSLEELRKAFEEAKAKGGVVGDLAESEN